MSTNAWCFKKSDFSFVEWGVINERYFVNTIQHECFYVAKKNIWSDINEELGCHKLNQCRVHFSSLIELFKIIKCKVKLCLKAWKIIWWWQRYHISCGFAFQHFWNLFWYFCVYYEVIHLKQFSYKIIHSYGCE